VEYSTITSICKYVTTALYSLCTVHKLSALQTSSSSSSSYSSSCSSFFFFFFLIFLSSSSFYFFFFFLPFNLLIGLQFSICNCYKPLYPLLYNCQLLCFCRLALSIAVEVFPLPFFPDIAPSRMFTPKSLYPIICPIHKWCLFL